MQREEASGFSCKMNGLAGFIAELEQWMPYVRTIMSRISSFGVREECSGLASMKRNKAE